MITQSQQKTIDELTHTFERINELEQPSTDLMEQITAELNRATALKLKSEAALKTERAKAKELMSRHVSSVWKPILDKFLPDLKVDIWEDGGFHLGGISYHTFTIKSVILEDKNEDKSKSYRLAGFEITGYNNNPGRTISLPSFDEAFKKFVIDVKKSIDGTYY